MPASTLITDYLGKGLASARPAAPPVAPNALALWLDTDGGALWRWNGTNWSLLSSVWRAAAGAPSDSLGIDGDFYLNVSTGDVFERTSGHYVAAIGNIRGPVGATGSAGATGAAGAAGTPGTVLRNGHGVPANTLGVDGDYYLDDDTGFLYARSGGTYASVANLTGPVGATGGAGATGPAGPTGPQGPTGAGGTGTPGSVWREGAGTPSNSLGVDGDFYLNGTTGDVYLRTSGSYAAVTNIRGPTGAPGATGPAGATGATGPQGPAGTPATSRNNARLQAQWASGAIVQNDTIYLAYDAPYAGTINSLIYFAGTGSFTANVQINGVSVTGLGAVNVNSSTPATTNANAANIFTAGQRISVVITGATGAPTDAVLSANVTWS